MEESHPYANLLTVCLLIFIAINLFILDLKVFSPQSNIMLSEVSTSASPAITQITAPTKAETWENTVCPASCLSAISEATKSGLTIGGVEPKQSALITFSQTTFALKEYYIPLGTGTTQKNTWDDLTGTETVIDPVNYGNIKEAYFIASLRNPTQNGQTEVQLYNVTDKHPVWNSNLVMSGPASQTLTSGEISLDTGNKLYRVQLKNSMQYPVYLDNARIKIVSE